MKRDILKEGIEPFTDQEVREALARVCKSPLLPVISKFFFPKQPLNTLKKLLEDIHTVDEFQQVVMSKAVLAIIEGSSSGFSYDGLENIEDKSCKFLAISNHRDIFLDPALVQWLLFKEDMALTEICAGSNLLEGNRVVSDLLRSNRMIKVIRGVSARELYFSSQQLSKYIRSAVTSGRSTVWIAQREGRTKNGKDATEQGLLKMLDMSGEGDFKENFMSLRLTPFSISYEYESCDIRKARELLISRERKYVKRRNEDLHSIMLGIKQWKGGMHLNVGKPISEEELERAASLDRNERYQLLCRVIDQRIISGYKLWKTNYMAYDLLNPGNKYAEHYDKSDLEAFKEYTEHRLSKVERRLDRDELRTIFWEIYANPIVAKAELQNSEP